MNRVRILPLLKRLGYKQDKETPNIYKHESGIYEARVYKTSDNVRAMDIERTVFNEDGSLHHRENFLKQFPLDFEDSQYQFYYEWLQDMGLTFENPGVALNNEYYFSVKEERSTDDSRKPGH